MSHSILDKGGIKLKRIIIVFIAVLMLVGCSSGENLQARAMKLRSALQGSEGCSFDAAITADYGQKTYTFAMGCQFDAHGNLSFTVKEPETIAGITGNVSFSAGELTFDGNALAFPILADGQATPVSAPWFLYKALVGGYLNSCVQEDQLLHLIVDDSYEDDAMQLDIWLGTDDLPVRAEILYENRRILTLSIENFVIQ